MRTHSVTFLCCTLLTAAYACDLDVTGPSPTPPPPYPDVSLDVHGWDGSDALVDVPETELPRNEAAISLPVASQPPATQGPLEVNEGVLQLRWRAQRPALQEGLTARLVYPFDLPDGRDLYQADPSLRSLWRFDDVPPEAALFESIADSQGHHPTTGEQLYSAPGKRYSAAHLRGAASLGLPLDAISLADGFALTLWGYAEATATTAAHLLRPQSNATMNAKTFTELPSELPFGYGGAVFDGRYLHLIPSSTDGEGPHRTFARYDTLLDFSAPEAWDTFDAADAGLPNDGQGYLGGAFDGRYIYFAPHGAVGTRNLYFLRLDTLADYQDPNAWSYYFAGIDFPGAQIDRFGGALFDGRFVYFSPYGPTNNLVLRYDTQRDFSATNAWTHFNTTGIGVAQPQVANIVYDGRFAYFIPHGQGATPSTTLLRLDTQEIFTTASAWAALELPQYQAWGSTFSVNGIYTAAFDGKELCLSVRAVNVLNSFHTDASHSPCTATPSPVDPTAITWTWRDNGHSQPFTAAVFTGEDLYTIYRQNLYPEATLLVKNPFGASSQIEITRDGNTRYPGLAFDGRAVYPIPAPRAAAPARALTQVTLREAGGEGSLDLWLNLNPQGGLSAGPPGLTVAYERNGQRQPMLVGPPLPPNQWTPLTLSVAPEALHLDVGTQRVTQALPEAPGANMRPHRFGPSAVPFRLDDLAWWLQPRTPADAITLSQQNTATNALDSERFRLDLVDAFSSSAGNGPTAFAEGLRFDAPGHGVMRDQSSFSALAAFSLQTWLRPDFAVPGNPSFPLEAWQPATALQAQVLTLDDKRGADTHYPCVASDGQRIYYFPGTDDQPVLTYALAQPFSNDRWQATNQALATCAAVAFDGRYFYLVKPDSTTVVRFDPSRAIDDATAFVSITPLQVPTPDQRLASVATFDGHFLYLAVDSNNGAALLRYDTTQDFEMNAAWLAFPIEADFQQASTIITTGAHLFLMGWRRDPTRADVLLRLDLAADPSAPESWHLRNLSGHYARAAFDGRHLYLCPEPQQGQSQPVLRYDTFRAMDNPNAYQQAPVDIQHPLAGGIFDGTYVIFPARTTQEGQRWWRYHTGRTWSNPQSWQDFDVPATATALFDGRFIYGLPLNQGAIRVDTAHSTNAHFRLASSLGSQSSTHAAGPLGPTAVFTHIADNHLLSLPTALAAEAWHEVSMSFSPLDRINLYLQGQLLANIPARSAMRPGTPHLHVARGYSGSLDDLVLWEGAQDNAFLYRHVADGYQSGQSGAAIWTFDIPAAHQPPVWGRLDVSGDFPADSIVAWQIAVGDGEWHTFNGLSWEKASEQPTDAAPLESFANALGRMPSANSLKARAFIRSNDPAISPTISAVQLTYYHN